MHKGLHLLQLFIWDKSGNEDKSILSAKFHGRQSIMLTKDNKNWFLQYTSLVIDAHTIPVTLHCIRKLWKLVSLTKIMYWLKGNDKPFSLIFAYLVVIASGSACILQQFIGTGTTCRSSSRDHAKARKFTPQDFQNTWEVLNLGENLFSLSC